MFKFYMNMKNKTNSGDKKFNKTIICQQDEHYEIASATIILS